MKRVTALKDDSGHWYVVPSDEAKDFNALANKIESTNDNMDLIDEFEDRFSKYRTGGDLNLIQLYAEI